MLEHGWRTVVAMDQQIAELEHLFAGRGWRFGSVWQSAGSGPDARSLTASKGGVLLAGHTVAGLAEKIRREESS